MCVCVHISDNEMVVNVFWKVISCFIFLAKGELVEFDVAIQHIINANVLDPPMPIIYVLFRNMSIK